MVRLSSGGAAAASSFTGWLSKANAAHADLWLQVHHWLQDASDGQIEISKVVSHGACRVRAPAVGLP